VRDYITMITRKKEATRINRNKLTTPAKARSPNGRNTFTFYSFNYWLCILSCLILLVHK
jgi:hypothetical protein